MRMMLIGFSVAFGYMMVILQIPAKATQCFLGSSHDKYVFLLMVNVILLFIGSKTISVSPPTTLMSLISLNSPGPEPCFPSSATGAPTTTGGYPRFGTDPKGPVTVGSVVSANTTLLIPYAVRIPSINFETGIALANTTKDPWAVGVGGATETAGTVTLTLYPSTATGTGTEFH